MYVRKKKNKGGTYSIMLVIGERHPGKKNPITRIIKNFGSSADEGVIAKLTEEAEAYRRELLLASPKAKTLKITSASDFSSCDSYNTGFADVYGTLFDRVFNKVSLKPLALKQLRDLVTLRIAMPASKRRTAYLAKEYGIKLKLDTIYKLMDQLTESKITEIKETVYQQTTRLLEEKKETIDVLFYDLTTIYFETNTQDDLRDFGYSKDGKHQHVQIVLAVIVTQKGLPVDYQAFPGNCYEGHTLLPALNELKARYQLGRVVLVADAALMNQVNLQALSAQKIDYIIAARIKSLKKTIKNSLLNHEDYQLIATDKSQNNPTDFIKSKTIQLDNSSSLVTYYSSKRARKDAYEREENIKKITAYLLTSGKKTLTNCLRKPYISASHSSICIDPIKLADEQQYDGFFAIITNIPNPNPAQLLTTYTGLWQIEQTFRIAKSQLEIRPVYHYSNARIKAHLAICYISLALVRYAEFILQSHNLFIPLEQLHLILEQIRFVQINSSSNDIFHILQNTPQEYQAIYHALNIKTLKKFSYQPQL